MAPLALIANLATRWLHLHELQIWPTDGAAWIGSTSGHQMPPFTAPGWVRCIATLPGIARLTLSVGIELVSSSARVTSVKSQQGVSVSQ